MDLGGEQLVGIPALSAGACYYSLIVYMYYSREAAEWVCLRRVEGRVTLVRGGGGE